MIEGVKKVPLRQIQDERGKVMQMLKATDPHFQQFGEVYFSWVNPNIIKAWHKHTKMLMNYAVPIGCIKVVLYDDRQDSSTFKMINEYFMNSEDYYLLMIPPNVWYGFTSVGGEKAMVVNCTSLPHDPNEIIRISPFDPQISYSWDVKHG